MTTCALPQPDVGPKSSASVSTISQPRRSESTPRRLTPMCEADALQSETPPSSPPPVSDLFGEATDSEGEEYSSTTTSTDTTQDSEDCLPKSTLHPPHSFPQIDRGSLSIYALTPQDVVDALRCVASQPYPDAHDVFPWLHGMHPDNDSQRLFFAARGLNTTSPPCRLRGVTVVKADSDLSTCRLKGAIAPRDFLNDNHDQGFLHLDPPAGFGVRNFHIQTVKSAMTSDIVVYGEHSSEVHKLAWRIARAQQRCRGRLESQGINFPTYNTFVCVAPFAMFEDDVAADLVAVNSAGQPTGRVLDLVEEEHRQMVALTRATEISHNVWLGPPPNPATNEACDYDIIIECSEHGRYALAIFSAVFDAAAVERLASSPSSPPLRFDFPASGIISSSPLSPYDANAILAACKSIYNFAHGRCNDTLGDNHYDTLADATSPSPRKILIYCQDGYTETTLLALAYFSYSTGRTIPQAWVDLHTTMQRNFFAFASDVTLLRSLGPRLFSESPVRAHLQQSVCQVMDLLEGEPEWMHALDGSLPSRILDYLYLGNLTHANNPGMLRAIGIGQIISVGETIAWFDEELERWGDENRLAINGIQDNGIDSLSGIFQSCFDFIDRGRKKDVATLVHCRVGVSRSATICIAEVMRSLVMSFPRAYCLVRARRLHVIIQPHVKFAYELLKFDEELQARAADHDGHAGSGIYRELEWPHVTAQIAHLNQPYGR